ncbi:MAG: hypothetical protein ABI488_00345 [Polyangiaceae bacterium]
MNEASQKVRIGATTQHCMGLVFVAALVSVPACASLLGIEDIHEDPSASAGTGDSTSGAGRSASDGGQANPDGGSRSGGGANTGAGSNATGGDAGEGPNGGASAGGTSGAGGRSVGGTSGTSGAGASGGGSAGLAGAAGAGGGSGAVHGHVIDFWGHQLSAVPVQIGASQVMTDAEGGFTIANVPAQYDVSLSVSFTDNGRVKTRGWVYQGLTLREPTLQVYEGLKQLTGSLTLQPNNPAALTSVRNLTVALGGPDITRTTYDVSSAGTNGDSVAWEGPAATQITAHALIWEDGSDGFPAKFIAYDSKPVGLSSLTTTAATASFSLVSGTPNIAVGTVTGTVAGTEFADRTNSVFLRFTSNAVMRLLSDTPTTAGFVYKVPSITNTTITVAAARGDLYNSQYALVHRDGLLPGAAGINLTIPTPATALAVIPAGDLNKASASTQFGFTAASGSVPFVAVFTGFDPSVSDDRLYVVGSKTPFTLPKVNGLNALKAGEEYVFRVETHGTPASVDAMAGPSGFLDAFSADDYAASPAGPRTADGSYTISTVLTVTAAP